MVGPCPERRFVGFRANFNPFLGLPVEDADGVEPLLVGPSPSEEDQLIVVLIVVHGAVGPMRGDVPGCGHLVPLHGDGVEGPEVVHVVGVYVGEGVPA